MNINNKQHIPYASLDTSLKVPTNTQGLDIESQASPDRHHQIKAFIPQNFDISVQSEGTLSTRGQNPKIIFENKENLSLKGEFQVGIQIPIKDLKSGQIGTVIFEKTENSNHYNYTLSKISPCTSNYPY